jgi:peptidoglycan/LPS O-acetylase OafA/YrhL
MARRLVRLWPVYAVVLTLGYATAGQFVPWRVLFWLPPFPRVEVDPPAWSLYWEAWATFFFPAAFWVARRSRALAMALAGASFGLTFLHPDLVYVMFFALGVAGSEFAIPWPQRMPGWSLWLGKISYSLYLTHAVVMRVAFSLGGPWAVAASVPAVFAAAWLIWWAVERPSINWSRRVSW